MTISLLVLCLALLAAQAAIYMTLRGRSGRPAAIARVLLIVELAVGLHAIAGVYAQDRWDVIGRITRWTEEQPPLPTFPPLPGGDPALLGLATESADPIARPDFGSADGFERWQHALRDRVRGTLLKNATIAPGQKSTYHEVAVETVGDGIRRHALTIRSFDGTTLPAYLFVPPSHGRTPAVLVLTGHVRKDSQSGLAQTAGLTPSYQHAAALELAKRGFVTLTFELRGFGLLGPPALPHHNAVAHNAIIAGSSYKAVLYRDVEAAVEVLLSRSEVDGERLGIAGASLGGEMATLYAAMDQRIRAVAINSFVPSSGPYPPATGWHGEEENRHICHTVPGENQVLLQEDWLYLIAPRALLVVYGERERYGDRTVLGRAYVELGLTGRHAIVEVPNRGHEFHLDQTSQFLRQQLASSGER